MWTYWHRLEYFRIERGARVLEHTEDVDDHGFYTDRDAPESYARLVAEDFLSRQGRPPGRWLVVLWRLDATGTRKVRRLCEFELTWPCPAASRSAPPRSGTVRAWR
ncbi:MAG TPA: hypothetical protein VIL00_11500 [Pseudonocardiaceae bacterium]